MQEHFFFIGTYAGITDESILLYKADFEDQKFSKVAAYKGTPNPSYLIQNSNGIIYAVEELVPVGNISTYRLERGGFSKQCTLASNGADPCHLALDDSERFLFVSNYTSGSLAVFELDDRSIPLGCCSVMKHEGSGTDPIRQEGPHVHFSKYMKGMLYVCDLGLDTVFCYRLNTEEKRLEKTNKDLHVPAGNGPRHLCFHPANSDWLYVAAELSANIFVYHFEEDTFVLKQEICSLNNVPKGNQLAAIKFSEDGKYLFVSNRGNDSLTAFAVTENNLLQLLDVCKTGGKAPRDFAHFGDYMIVANQDSSLLTVLHFDRCSNRFEQMAMQQKIGLPVCILETASDL